MMTAQLENVADVYALSPTQQGMLFHAISADQPGVYLVQMAVTIDGLSDPDRLIASLQSVCSRHDALKSFYVWDGVDEPLQIVRKEVKFPVARLDWRNDDAHRQRQQLLQLVDQNTKKGIDPGAAPLLRFSLCRCDENRYVLLFFFHHLILDGWSTQTLLTEILQHYEHGLNDVPKFQFRSYIEHLTQRDVDAECEFWKSELAGFTDANRIGFANADTQHSTTDHTQVSCFLTAQQTTGLRKLARASQVSLSSVVRAIWSLTVSRFSGGDSDIVFGVTTAGRPPELLGIESGIGSFINTIPFRTKINASQSIGDWLQNIQSNHGRASQWETSSLLQIQKNAEIASGADLFQSILVFENYPQRDTDEMSLSIAGTEHFEQSSYPLAILVVPNEEMEFIFVHDRNRFSSNLIEQIGKQIQWLADQMMLGCDETVESLCSVPVAQRAIAAESVSNQPATDFIDALFSSHSASNPNDIAIAFKEQEITYGELDHKSNQIANKLIASAIEPNMVVGICVDRSIEMLAGILGVLKAGGAYVPIDPAYPTAHIEHIVNDAQASLVLTTSVFANVLSDDVSMVYFEEIFQSDIRKESPKPTKARSAKDLAYLIYTSGSTGLPKGVKISHENLSYSTWARTEYYDQAPEVFLLLSSFSFDSSVVGIFWTLSTGGQLVLPEPDQEKDVQTLVSLIHKHKVSHLLCLPVLYELILEATENRDLLSSLTTAIVAGEHLSKKVVKQHFTAVPNVELHNEYGPTEATVWSTAHKLQTKDLSSSIPIGMPIAGTTVWLLDNNSRPVGWGAVGEICVEGPGLSNGYLNRPDLDSAKFVEIELANGEKKRVYRTGDLGYRRDDGNLVFAGRIDRQIKLRGYRIELGAIEEILSASTEISEARVTGWSHQTGNTPSKLIAFYTGQSTDPTILKQRVSNRLPHYMVPEKFVHVGSFPRLGNGKIDEAALPKETFNSPRADLATPKNETESRMLKVWQTVFGFDNIGVDENFFSIGGDSISSIRLISEARKAGFTLESPSVLIENPTISGLAKTGSSTKRADAKTVIRFNDCEQGMPIVCIHSGGKQAMYFRSLAKYFPDRPFIALQSKGLDGSPRAQSVEEVATDNIREIQNLFGDRPVHLVGYCKGSRVSLEMVHQLEMAGKKIGAWTVLDDGPDVPTVNVLSLAYHIRKQGSLAKALPGYAFYCIRNPVMSIFRWFYMGWLLVTGEENRRILYQSLVEFQARNINEAYKPKVVHEPLLFIGSTERERAELHSAWRQYVASPANIDTHTVSGVHDAMVVEPTVSQVAEIVSERHGNVNWASVDRMAKRSIDDEFTTAIQDQRLRLKLWEMENHKAEFSLEAQQQIAASATNIKELDDEIMQELTRLVTEFKKARLRRSMSGMTQPDRFLHALKLELYRCNVDHAAALLETLGYKCELRSAPGLWTHFRRFFKQAEFWSTEGTQFRVTLSWNLLYVPQSRIGKLLWPRLDDLKAVSLPRFLSPLYVVVRLARRIFNLQNGEHATADLGVFLATPQSLIMPLLQFAELDASDTLVDLGCGDGRILATAAKEFGCQCRGYETDPELVKNFELEREKGDSSLPVEVLCEDALSADLSDATVVFLFLPVSVMRELVPKLLNRMKPGAKLVVHEQERLRIEPAPDKSVPLISNGGVTIAHKWIVPS